MGDRREVKFEDMGIWFYTHWEGYCLVETLRNAISQAKGRWGDDSYCFRIILHNLMESSSKATEDTGCGIANYEMDTQYKINPVVNIKKQKVEIDGNSYTFKQFVEIDIDEHWNE